MTNRVQKPRTIMIVEDDAGLRKQLRWALAEDYTVEEAGDQSAAIAILRREDPAVIMLDLGLPPDPNGASEGLATLEEILTFNPGAKVIVSSGNDDRRFALEAIRLGAYDFYPKPVDIDVLRLIIQRAFVIHDLEAENRKLSTERPMGLVGGVVAESSVMAEICRIIERVASSNVTVLLIGESGTGKEVLAQALHTAGDRGAGKFHAINCAAVPEQLLESELFGHERGAFTGAIKQTIGKFEQANGGTLFLDEIGDMPLATQAKLLRFLQERTFERVGGRQTISVDVRVVAATNRNLKQMIAEQQFREDLFYRLAEIEVSVPPLRDRHGDAVLLARYYYDRLRPTLKSGTKGFSPEALSALSSYQWPGNVRELVNRVKRALVLASGDLITPADLGLEAGRYPTLRELRERTDRDAVNGALAMVDGNISATAKLLGISRPTLYELISSLGIRV
jgi:two-component system NtrC family response regulator